MKPELKFTQEKMRVAFLGEESSLPDLFGEQILQNNLEFRLDEDDEIYEGYGRRYSAYPYRKYNGYTRKNTEKEVKTAVLENEYLKAVFLPEYGGRLWELWDKETNTNLLYTNDVIQFSNLAVRNAWFSGGVEWNIGVIGHSPLTLETMYTAKIYNENNEPVLRMYEFERVRKVVYQMDFWLEEKGKFLNCRMRITNESDQVIPMYWWSNMAVPEYEKGKIIVPARRAFTYADGAVFKVDLPVVNGDDITEYKNIPKSVDYFFDIETQDPKYIANVDESGHGMLHLSTNRLRSRKLFSWGKLQGSDHWQNFLTDQAGRYIEIQAGLGKTQYGCLPMAPHTAWEWIERYGAVHLSEEILKEEHQKRADCLTEYIKEHNYPEEMETLLKTSKATARKKAEVVYWGSGYGAMAERGKMTDHLEFKAQTASLKNWLRFKETGEFVCHDPQERPDEFLMNDEMTALLEKTIETVNKDNWYAFYQLGIGLYVQEKYEKAQEMLKRSYELQENAWSLHALSCVSLLKGRNQEASDYIRKGMELRKEDLSYLKEGFKTLLLTEHYQEVLDFYESLDETMQKEGRLCLNYISALFYSGQKQKAFDLLMRDGGLEVADIREGETSLAALWQGFEKEIFQEERAIPYQLDYRAF